METFSALLAFCAGRRHLAHDDITVMNLRTSMVYALVECVRVGVGERQEC